jgi:hypothetical protein
MVKTSNNGERKKVSALRDLSRGIEPPDALWSRIEAEIARGQQRGAVPSSRAMSWRGRSLAAAAVIAALAAGMMIGRLLLPAAAPAGGAGLAAQRGATPSVPVAYVTDPRYLQERAALLRSLQAQLAALPPDSRAKVQASLATIHQSMLDLEAALGRDPSNALLQELLVNTYQDEMRVLTTVHEASETGQGI